MKDQKKMQAAVVEAILFVYGKDLTYERIGELMDVTEDDVRTFAKQLSEEYQKRQSGLRIIVTEDSVQMVTHPEVAGMIEEMTKKEIEGPLTPVAMEVLSIIAYRGPIGKVDIEAIRGVNCSFTIRNLVRRGLIERAHDDGRTRSHLYRVTIDFLRILGIASVEELPEFAELATDKRIDAILIRERESEEGTV